jgi:hypothetical protein
MVLNTAFFPKLMWNSRFAARSGDPFENSAGFLFPPPEGLSLSTQPHLLVAQAFIPPTERTGAAGFGVPGDNDALRAEVLNRLNRNPAYRKLFGEIFPEVKAGAPISFDMFGKAITEFELTLTFADAPIDRFARGERAALSEQEKRGALLFFGAARCSTCHSVAGSSNEMFSWMCSRLRGSTLRRASSSPPISAARLARLSQCWRASVRSSRHRSGLRVSKSINLSPSCAPACSTHALHRNICASSFRDPCQAASRS